MKRCPRCEQNKSRDEFYNCRSLPDGKCAICKVCSKMAAKEYRGSPKGRETKRQRENTPRYKEAARLRRTKYREKKRQLNPQSPRTSKHSGTKEYHHQKCKKYRETHREQERLRRRQWYQTQKGKESARRRAKRYYSINRCTILSAKRRNPLKAGWAEKQRQGRLLLYGSYIKTLLVRTVGIPRKLIDDDLVTEKRQQLFAIRLHRKVEKILKEAFL